MTTEDDYEEELPPITVGVAASMDANAGSTFPVEPPFGPDFFQTTLADRVRDRCGDDAANVPIVQLRLADGTTLDVCHIPTLDRLWLAVEVYRDPETCADMDLVFLPYETVTRVTIAMWPESRRPIGFRVGG